MLFKRKMADKTPEKPEDNSGNNNNNNSNNNYNNGFRRPGSYSENYKKRYDSYFGKSIKDEINRGKASSVSKETNNNPIKKVEQGAVKEFKKLEREGEKIYHDVERVVYSRKAKRIEKIIIGVIYAVVILIGIYFLLATFFPEYVPGANTYTISAKDSKIFSTLSSFYIEDQSVLGEKNKTEDGTIIRPIQSSKKFNFVFKPKENIPKGKKATFELNLVLNKDKLGNIYVNEELIFPDLTNYELLKETETDYVYIQKDVRPYINENNFQNADTTEDYIYKNMPGVSVWATRKLNPVEVNIPDYQKINTLINGTFRGDLKLAVYAEGELNVDFVKQDLNVYLGEDTYAVNITNSNGDRVYTNVFADDGDKTASNKLGKNQDFNINVNNLKADVYYVNFDDTSEGSDTSIKQISINSNKILILGSFLPWINGFDFYTKSSTNKKIGFYYWWQGKDQIINVTGISNKNINLDTSWINKRYDENFVKGEYAFNVEKGYLQIYSDVSSLSEENWFDIPSLQQIKFDNPNIIFIDKYNFDEDIGFLSYTMDVDATKTPVKISLRTLNSGSAGFKDARMIIK